MTSISIQTSHARDVLKLFNVLKDTTDTLRLKFDKRGVTALYSTSHLDVIIDLSLPLSMWEIYEYNGDAQLVLNLDLGKLTKAFKQDRNTLDSFLKLRTVINKEEAPYQFLEMTFSNGSQILIPAYPDDAEKPEKEPILPRCEFPVTMTLVSDALRKILETFSSKDDETLKVTLQPHKLTLEHDSIVEFKYGDYGISTHDPKAYPAHEMVELEVGSDILLNNNLFEMKEILSTTHNVNVLQSLMNHLPSLSGLAHLQFNEDMLCVSCNSTLGTAFTANGHLVFYVASSLLAKTEGFINQVKQTKEELPTIQTLYEADSQEGYMTQLVTDIDKTLTPTLSITKQRQLNDLRKDAQGLIEDIHLIAQKVGTVEVAESVKESQAKFGTFEVVLTKLQRRKTRTWRGQQTLTHQIHQLNESVNNTIERLLTRTSFEAVRKERERWDALSKLCAQCPDPILHEDNESKEEKQIQQEAEMGTIAEVEPIIDEPIPLEVEHGDEPTPIEAKHETSLIQLAEPEPRLEKPLVVVVEANGYHYTQSFSLDSEPAKSPETIQPNPSHMFCTQCGERIPISEQANKYCQKCEQAPKDTKIPLSSKMFEHIEESRDFLIIGGKGKGKTALGCKILDAHHENTTRSCFVYKPPKPELFPDWITPTENLDELPQGAVCLIDEASMYFDQYSYRNSGNRQLAEIMRIGRQNNQTFVIIAHTSSIVNTNLILPMDVFLLKEPSQFQRFAERAMILQAYKAIKETIQKNEYYWLDSNTFEKESFSKPNWFTEELSNAYSNYRPESETKLEPKKEPKEEKQEPTHKHRVFTLRPSIEVSRHDERNTILYLAIFATVLVPFLLFGHNLPTTPFILMVLLVALCYATSSVLAVRALTRWTKARLGK